MDPAVQRYFAIHQLPLSPVLDSVMSDEDEDRDESLYQYSLTSTSEHSTTNDSDNEDHVHSYPRASMESDSSLVVDSERPRPFAFRTVTTLAEPSATPRSSMSSVRSHHRRSQAISMPSTTTRNSTFSFPTSYTSAAEDASTSAPRSPRKIRFSESAAIVPEQPELAHLPAPTASPKKSSFKGSLRSILRGASNAPHSPTPSIHLDPPSSPDAYSPNKRPFHLTGRHDSTASTASLCSTASSANTSLLFDDLPTPPPALSFSLPMDPHFPATVTIPPHSRLMDARIAGTEDVDVDISPKDIIGKSWADVDTA